VVADNRLTKLSTAGESERLDIRQAKSRQNAKKKLTIGKTHFNLSSVLYTHKTERVIRGYVNEATKLPHFLRNTGCWML